MVDIVSIDIKKTAFKLHKACALFFSLSRIFIINRTAERLKGFIKNYKPLLGVIIKRSNQANVDYQS